MSKINHEDLSAFMDGEFEGNSAGVIERLLADPDSRDAWMRYHLIAEAMRQSLPGHLDSRLSTSVSEKLQDEPVVLRPAGKRAPGYLKPVAGLAIAASVASVAILGIQQQRGEETAPGLNRTSSVAVIQPNIPMERQMGNPAARPASIDSGRSVSVNRPAPLPRAREEVTDPRLNNYLINYNEYHANTGMQGMLPYARMVAHDRYE